MRVIRNSVSYIFKILSYPFIAVGMTLMVIGSVIRCGVNDTITRLENKIKQLKEINERCNS